MPQIEKKNVPTAYKFRAEYLPDALGFLSLLYESDHYPRNLRLEDIDFSTVASFETNASLYELTRMALDAHKDWHRIAQTMAHTENYTGDHLLVDGSEVGYVDHELQTAALRHGTALLIIPFRKEGKVEIIEGIQQFNHEVEIYAAVARGGIPAGIMTIERRDGNVTDAEFEPFPDHYFTAHECTKGRNFGERSFSEWWREFVLNPIECYAQILEERAAAMPEFADMARELATEYIG